MRTQIIVTMLMLYGLLLGKAWAQYRAPEAANCGAGNAGTCFSVYREGNGGWWVQNCCIQNTTGRLRFIGNNTVFSIEDCLQPKTRKYLWWMVANPSLALEVVGSGPC